VTLSSKADSTNDPDVDHQKISRTILKAAFVAISFVVTGKFVGLAFAMRCSSLCGFREIALATTMFNVQETGDVEHRGFITCR